MACRHSRSSQMQGAVHRPRPPSMGACLPGKQSARNMSRHSTLRSCRGDSKKQGVGAMFVRVWLAVFHGPTASCSCCRGRRGMWGIAAVLMKE